MRVPVLNMQGEKIETIDLPASIFEANVNVGLMHQAYVRQQANARAGTHKTKSRGEIRCSTRKIYRQKGTGRARHGARSAPIFVGGGVAHGPRPRDYSLKMPRKMRQAALRSALTAKAQDGDLVVVDMLALERPKTRRMVEILSRLAGDASALILLSERNENDRIAGRYPHRCLPPVHQLAPCRPGFDYPGALLRGRQMRRRPLRRPVARYR